MNGSVYRLRIRVNGWHRSPHPVGVHPGKGEGGREKIQNSKFKIQMSKFKMKKQKSK
jgi:hypothetical protein